MEPKKTPKMKPIGIGITAPDNSGFLFGFTPISAERHLLLACNGTIASEPKQLLSPCLYVPPVNQQLFVCKCIHLERFVAEMCR